MAYALICTDISNKEIIYFKTFPDLPTAKFRMRVLRQAVDSANDAYI